MAQGHKIAHGPLALMLSNSVSLCDAVASGLFHYLLLFSFSRIIIRHHSLARAGPASLTRNRRRGP